MSRTQETWCSIPAAGDFADVYDGITFDEGLRLDVLVENIIICELKSVDELHPVHLTQLISQLGLAHKQLGFLLNFHVPLMKNGIKRVVA